MLRSSSWWLAILLFKLLTTCFDSIMLAADAHGQRIPDVGQVGTSLESYPVEPEAMCGQNSFFCTENECIPIGKQCNGVAECSNGNDESVRECGCLPNEFSCNGTCIESMLRCDTRVDCDDGSDETNCEAYACPFTHFKCNNNFCIPGDFVCNFVDDCGDNSDEQNCYHRNCWFGEYKCHNGQCIRVALLCDGHEDCLDGSDEIQCDPKVNHVECGDKTLMHQYFWCDDWPDCHDNHADELHCRNCTEKEFRCLNSRCIAKANVCDMICDCAETCEDEKDCEQYVLIDNTPICLLNSTIYCQKTGRCIHERYLCDGRHDCQSGEDGSDEYHCFQAPTNCSADEFACPDGRCLPASVRCDFINDCIGGADEDDCEMRICTDSEFRCFNGQCIPQSGRCNSFHDCRDRSDELYCVNNHCLQPSLFRCKSGHCIPSQWQCDFYRDCPDNSDEQNCKLKLGKCSSDEFMCNNGQCIPKQYVCFHSANERLGCADGSHLLNCRNWQCSSSLHKCLYSYCINESLVCNEQIDCWGSWSDESGCPFKCSNEVRCECRDITINCTNLGLKRFPPDIEKEISRYFFSGNKLKELRPGMFRFPDSIQLLDLSNNSITFVPPEIFQYLWRLKILYLQDNYIAYIQNRTFSGLINVVTLNIQRNNIRVLEPFAFYGLSSLKLLDLNGQQLINISQNAFIGLRSLLNLNLSRNKLLFLIDGVFNGLQQLLSLDLGENQIQIMGSNVFHGLPSLHKIITDEFRFCCLARHVSDCFPKPDEFSSCEDLMSNIIQRVCIWILGLIAFTGNILVIIWRNVCRTNNKVHSLLITNLAFGDMCMGIYLMIIAAVDYHYRGSYFIYDSFWKTSGLCQFAGFVSTFSSELSVFTLTAISIDRYVTIMFPFRIKRLKMFHMKVIMIVIWSAAVILAGLPLLNIDYFQHFYGRSGVCLALHITDEKPSGWEYAVFIFLALNLLSFFVISAAYIAIFFVARNTQKAARSPEAKQDNTMAKRMSIIVFTDFCCWMPIIVLAIVSLSGITVPPQVFAWIAVFILPLNAAINPVLYTLSTTPFLGPTRRRISRLRMSCMTYVTSETGRTQTVLFTLGNAQNSQRNARFIAQMTEDDVMPQNDNLQ